MSAKAGTLPAAGYTGAGAWIVTVLFAILLTAALLAVNAGSSTSTDAPTATPVTTGYSNPDGVARAHPHRPAATLPTAATFGEPFHVGDDTCHQCA
jgi:hypothetical protein